MLNFLPRRLLVGTEGCPQGFRSADRGVLIRLSRLGGRSGGCPQTGGEVGTESLKLGIWQHLLDNGAGGFRSISQHIARRSHALGSKHPVQRRACGNFEMPGLVVMGGVLGEKRESSARIAFGPKRQARRDEEWVAKVVQFIPERGVIRSVVAAQGCGGFIAKHPVSSAVEDEFLQQHGTGPATEHARQLDEGQQRTGGLWVGGVLMSANEGVKRHAAR